MDSQDEAGLNSMDPSWEEAGRPGFLARLWRGDVSLPITYWVFWAGIGGGVFSIIGAILSVWYVELVTWEYGMWLINGYFWLIVAYTVFMAVPVWRSATKHDGSTFWAVVAKIIVVFGVLTVFYYALMKVGLLAVNDSDLEAEIENINRGLPMMIDDVTRMESASMSGRDMKFEMAVLEVNAEALNQELFARRMREILAPTLCQDRQLLASMRDGRRIIYVYRDDAERVISEIVIDASDCEPKGQ